MENCNNSSDKKPEFNYEDEKAKSTVFNYEEEKAKSTVLYSEYLRKQKEEAMNSHKIGAVFEKEEENIWKRNEEFRRSILNKPGTFEERTVEREKNIAKRDEEFKKLLMNNPNTHIQFKYNPPSYQHQSFDNPVQKYEDTAFAEQALMALKIKRFEAAKELYAVVDSLNPTLVYKLQRCYDLEDRDAIFNALVMACQEGQVEAMKTIMKYINLNEMNKIELLKTAVSIPYPESLQFFIKEKYNIYHQYGVLLSVCCSNVDNPEIIKILIDQGLDIHYSDDEPLFNAVATGRYNAIVFLLKNGANPNARGRTLFRECAKWRKDYPEITKLFIAQNINIVSNYQHVIGHFLRSNFTESVAILIDHRKQLDEEENMQQMVLDKMAKPTIMDEYEDEYEENDEIEEEFDDDDDEEEIDE